MKSPETQPALYDAFISYRRVPVDRGWALWLHRSLEAWRTPRALVARGVPRKLERVFRDDEESHVSASLTDVINQALAQSRFLIVVCSPRAAQSKWINAEITEFIRLGRRNCILPLLIEGEPDTAFPAALRTARESGQIDEPLAADVRGARGVFQRGRRRRALLKLLAPILGCRFDDLAQRARERSKRRKQAIAVAVAVAAMIGLSLWGLSLQRQQYQLAIHAQDSLRSDPTRAFLLSLVAFERSRKFGGIGGEVATDALERALIEDRLRAQFNASDRYLHGLAWHPSGIIVAGGFNGRVATWDRAQARFGPSREVDAGIHQIVFRPKETVPQLAIAGATRVVNLWKLGNDDVIRLPSGNNSVITVQLSALSWSSDGRRLATSDGVDHLVMWDLATSREPRHKMFGKGQWVSAVAWSPNCDLIAVASMGELFLWDVARDVTIAVGSQGVDTVNRGPDRAEGIVAMDWRPEDFDSGEIKLVSGSSGGALYIARIRQDWNDADRATRVVGFELQGMHSDAVTAVAWHPQSDVFASASEDGTVKVWTKVPYRARYSSIEIPTNQGGTLGLAWSPDGNELASSGKDGTVRIWRISDEPESVELGGVQRILAPDEDRRHLWLPYEVGPMTPDGRRLDSAELEAFALSRVTRELSDEECMKYLNGPCPAPFAPRTDATPASLGVADQAAP